MNIQNKLLPYLDNEHINSLSKERPRGYYVEETDNNPVMIDVPTSMICGIDRFLTSESWLSVYYAHFGIKDFGYNLNYSPNKLDTLIDSLNTMGVTKFFESINKERIEPIQAFYYPKEDSFFVAGDGNHRAYIAKLMNVDKLTCKVESITEIRLPFVL